MFDGRMLISLKVELAPRAPVTLPLYLGRAVYAAMLDRLRALDACSGRRPASPPEVPDR